MNAESRRRMVHHRSRSDMFLRTMQLCAEDLLGQDYRRYEASVPLLAVHAAISLNDAILIACSGKRSKDQDHRVAAKMLQELCAKRKLPTEGVQHLKWLVQRKTKFSYGDESIASAEIQQARLKAEPFARWAYANVPELTDEDDNAAV